MLVDNMHRVSVVSFKTYAPLVIDRGSETAVPCTVRQNTTNLVPRMECKGKWLLYAQGLTGS